MRGIFNYVLKSLKNDTIPGRVLGIFNYSIEKSIFLNSQTCLMYIQLKTL
jgi:hypothetical protein